MTIDTLAGTPCMQFKPAPSRAEVECTGCQGILPIVS